MKQLLKVWLPPAIVSLYREWKRSADHEGNYASWQEALAHSTGYDSDKIFQRVREAALKVKSGEALFERDSICFYNEDYRWPTLACLLAIAAERDGQLHVLDFGGSLGSFYFQHRKFFLKLKEVRWGVVEQPHFVACGHSELEDEALRFYESIDDCIAGGQVDVIFLSSVLQYLDQPYGLLTDLGKTKAQFLLIDRTAFIEDAEDRLTIQKVPDSIYRASYPAWFFSRKKFDAAIAGAGYRLIAEFPCDDVAGIGNYKGIFLERV